MYSNFIIPPYLSSRKSISIWDFYGYFMTNIRAEMTNMRETKRPLKSVKHKDDFKKALVKCFILIIDLDFSLVITLGDKSMKHL